MYDVFAFEIFRVRVYQYSHINHLFKYNSISYVDTKRVKTEIRVKHIERGVSRAQYDIFFFKDPHRFPYFPSLYLHDKFILPMISLVYQLISHQRASWTLNWTFVYIIVWWCMTSLCKIPCELNLKSWFLQIVLC